MGANGKWTAIGVSNGSVAALEIGPVDQRRNQLAFAVGPFARFRQKPPGLRIDDRGSSQAED